MNVKLHKFNCIAAKISMTPTELENTLIAPKIFSHASHVMTFFFLFYENKIFLYLEIIRLVFPNVKVI